MDTFQALGVTLIGIIPGAAAVWSYERHAGSWGLKSPDRLYRFIGTSAIIALFFAPISYWLWTGPFHADISSRHYVPIGYWFVLIAYLVIPATIGYWLGTRVESTNSSIGKIIRGPNAAPTAWDHMFRSKPDGIIRIKLKSGTWLAGIYGPNEDRFAYASSYPEPPSLLLSRAIDVDALTGAFKLEAGFPVFLSTSILIEWEEIEYVLFDRGN